MVSFEQTRIILECLLPYNSLRAIQNETTGVAATIRPTPQGQGD